MKKEEKVGKEKKEKQLWQIAFDYQKYRTSRRLRLANRMKWQPRLCVLNHVGNISFNIILLKDIHPEHCSLHHLDDTWTEFQRGLCVSCGEAIQQHAIWKPLKDGCQTTIIKVLYADAFQSPKASDWDNKVPSQGWSTVTIVTGSMTIHFCYSCGLL